MIGFALTGSFCTISKALETMKSLVLQGYDILPIMSENVYNTNTRFACFEDVRKRAVEISGKKIIHTITEAEPLGPKIKLDAMIVCPCTGNTLSKIANGITDTSVTMATKAHLRNNNPLLIALASNDALSANLKNIATLMSRKNVYFVPMHQDDPINKPHSLVAEFDLVENSLRFALLGKQDPKIFI
ncbi:MAG: dipicolinate synthase subunit B [Clostridia bacterium]|nr:dipicolinate synthase subunit B [Clostridia bacterium]